MNIRKIIDKKRKVPRKCPIILKQKLQQFEIQIVGAFLEVPGAGGKILNLSKID